jgi:hypothetical protein
MAVTDPALGLNGNGFHTFPAIKVNTTPQLGSAENDAASGGQFLFLRSCRPRRVWISGEVQGRIALERLTLSYDGEPFDASAYPDISGRIHPPSPSTVHGGESVSLAEIFT